MSDERYYYNGIYIHKDDPEYINEFSRTLLEGHYTRKDETISESFGRASIAFCAGDLELAQRIYDYVYKGWFIFSSPILSNAPKGKWINGEFQFEEKIKGMPISCYALDIPDTIKGQIAAQNEIAELSISGGGVGGSNLIRGITDIAPGPIPYMKNLDGLIGYYRQGKTRRGAFAYFLNIDHPSINEFIRFRVSGGDRRRRSDNIKQFHNGVNLTDSFIKAVLENTEIDLVCPHSGRIYETVYARKLWEEILETRALTGEPYIWKVDLANRLIPESQRLLGLRNTGSNICVETIPALSDNNDRTYVCALASPNAGLFDEWKNTLMIKDIVYIIDNVIDYFIQYAPDSLNKATYNAMRERAIGIGQLGFHSFLQSKMIPLESGGVNSAVQWANIISKHIKDQAYLASHELAKERGESPDMEGTGMRNSRLIAIAPNSNSADILGFSPGIEPWYRNIFVKDTRVGSFQIKNKNLEKLLRERGRDNQEVWDDINAKDGSVQHLDFLSEHEKSVFKTAMEIDQHWLVELADQRGKYVDQAQSLNLFFPAGASREYVNSVHLKYLKSENVVSLYYYRTERHSKVDIAKNIERKALEDWNGEECISCQG